MTLIPPADNAARARTAITVFKIYMGMVALVALVSIYYCSVLIGFNNGETSQDQFVMASLMYIGITILRVVAFVVNVVTFILWFRRAYNNLYKIGVHGLQWTEGWAAGSWFVPILNLFAPYQIMREIWHKTQTMSKPEETQVHSDAIVGWWWGTFIACGIVAGIVNAAIEDNDTPETMMATVMGDLVVQLLYLIPLILCIIMIKKVSIFEDQLFHRNWKDFFGDQTTQTPDMNPSA